MNRSRLKAVEDNSRADVVQKILWAVRQARPDRQAALLAERLTQCDSMTRKAIYALLTDTDLEALCGTDVRAYLATLPDATIQAIVEDRSGQRAQKELRRYQRMGRSKKP